MRKCNFVRLFLCLSTHQSVSKDNDRDNNEVKVSPRHEGEKLEAKKLEADPEVKEVRRGRTTSPEAVSTDYERMRRDRTRSPDIGDDDGRPRAKSPPPQLPRYKCYVFRFQRSVFLIKCAEQIDQERVQGTEGGSDAET